jgi:hypothetical protein
MISQTSRHATVVGALAVTIAAAVLAPFSLVEEHFCDL